MNHTIRTILEAEVPALHLIATHRVLTRHPYRHGHQHHGSSGSEAGYWHLYRYNPLRKQPVRILTLDSPEPPVVQEFIESEVRYYCR